MHRNYVIATPVAPLIFMLVLLTTGYRAAASGKDSTDYDHQTHIDAGLKYLSDNVYLGRKDSLVLPYISPSLSFHHSSGIFASGSVSYVPVPGRDHVDLVTLEAGYDHDFGKNINAGVYGDYFFYSNETNSIKSGQNASLGLYMGYSNDIIEPQLDFNVNLGSQTDYVASIMLDHSFSLLDEQLSVTPTAGIFAGTEHYYEAYLQKVKVTKKKAKTITTTSNTGDFKVVDYECSLPIKYTYRQWLITAVPTYALPVNAATITENGKTIKESLSNSFFLSVEADFRLKLHRGNQHAI